jgi:hypothetical protein
VSHQDLAVEAQVEVPVPSALLHALVLAPVLYFEVLVDGDEDVPQRAGRTGGRERKRETPAK